MAKGDLDKVLAGKPIYRHEDLRAIEQRWNGWADFLQFGTLGLLVFSMFILDALPKETAKAIIWYWAAVMFVLATTAFIVARIALKHRMKYLNAEGERVSEFMQEAIDKVKEK